MNSDDFYRGKYLKYKNKYLLCKNFLQNQKGGGYKQTVGIKYDTYMKDFIIKKSKLNTLPNYEVDKDEKHIQSAGSYQNLSFNNLYEQDDNFIINTLMPNLKKPIDNVFSNYYNKSSEYINVEEIKNRISLITKKCSKKVNLNNCINESLLDPSLSDPSLPDESLPNFLILGAGPNGMTMSIKLKEQLPTSTCILLDNRIISDTIKKPFSRLTNVKLDKELIKQWLPSIYSVIFSENNIKQTKAEIKESYIPIKIYEYILYLYAKSKDILFKFTNDYNDYNKLQHLIDDLKIDYVFDATGGRYAGISRLNKVIPSNYPAFYFMPIYGNFKFKSRSYIYSSDDLYHEPRTNHGVPYIHSNIIHKSNYLKDDNNTIDYIMFQIYPSNFKEIYELSKSIKNKFDASGPKNNLELPTFNFIKTLTTGELDNDMIEKFINSLTFKINNYHPIDESNIFIGMPFKVQSSHLDGYYEERTTNTGHNFMYLPIGDTAITPNWMLGNGLALGLESTSNLAKIIKEEHE